MNLYRSAAVAIFLVLTALTAAADDAGEIRARLETWADDFNGKRVDAACGLFSKDLISDTQGQGEADYETRCAIITRALSDPIRTFRYTPDIKEVIVQGDLAIVRLQWHLTVSPGNETSSESGMDVFRKEADGVWRIVRFIAFDNP
jgi:ketosteroid isomerase-like protein